MGRERQRVLKRMLDIIAASVGLVFLSPLLILVAVAIWMNMGRLIFFRQTRAGYKAEPFRVFKFKTMIDAYDSEGRPLPDRARIAPLGRLLRRTSVDELPQLFNVLRGEMSLVGPRPLKIEYLEFYSREQARRHEVRPGITGLAQIKGRNALSWEERFALDVWYVDHQNLFLDAQILLLTFGSLLSRSSVSDDGDLDVPSFTGSVSTRHHQGGLVPQR
jgi:sugar transferase EpsL